jgi:type IV secretory pathway VirB2 component (pilin)
MNELNELSTTNDAVALSNEDRQRHTRQLFKAMLIALLAQGILSAAATGLPWETPLGLVLSSLTGPVALVVAGASAFFGFWQLSHRPDVMEVNKSMVITPFSIAGTIGALTIVKTFFPGLAGAIV